MSIIASIIIAGSTVFVNTPAEALNYNPPTDTLELNIVQRNVSPLDCHVYFTPSECTNLQDQVLILWTAHTNRLAKVEAHKAAVAEKRKSAIEQVRENAKKRRSKLGKSSGGVK